jgi:hypothetical protein
MTDPSVTDGQAQVARFRVSQRALWLARLPALAMAASAIWLVFIPGRIEGNGSTSATVLAMFYGGWVTALTVAMTLAWAGWRRIPRKAASGTLEVGPDGVEYRVGLDRFRIPWDHITAIHPVRQTAGKPPIAFWLPKDRPTGLTRSQEFALYRTLHRSPYRPVERPDGMLLPLRLFGTAGARQIIDTLRRHLDMKEGG